MVLARINGKGVDTYFPSTMPKSYITEVHRFLDELVAARRLILECVPGTSTGYQQFDSAYKSIDWDSVLAVLRTEDFQGAVTLMQEKLNSWAQQYNTPASLFPQSRVVVPGVYAYTNNTNAVDIKVNTGIRETYFAWDGSGSSEVTLPPEHILRKTVAHSAMDAFTLRDAATILIQALRYSNMSHTYQLGDEAVKIGDGKLLVQLDASGLLVENKTAYQQMDDETYVIRKDKLFLPLPNGKMGDTHIVHNQTAYVKLPSDEYQMDENDNVFKPTRLDSILTTLGV